MKKLNLFETETRFLMIVGQLNQKINTLEQKDHLTEQEKLLLFHFYQLEHRYRDHDKNEYGNDFFTLKFWLPGTPKRIIPPKEKIEQIKNQLDETGAITTSEAQELLDFLGFYTRLYMLHYNAEWSQKEQQNLFKKTDFEGNCWIGSTISTTSLTAFGINSRMIDMKTFLPVISHEFSVASFPIKEQQQIHKKEYVIDYSYRQFLKISYLQQQANSFYQFLIQNHKRALFAIQLIENGYFELTEETAESYFGAFLEYQKELDQQFRRTSKMESSSLQTGKHYLELLPKKSNLLTDKDSGSINDRKRFPTNLFDSKEREKLLIKKR